MNRRVLAAACLALLALLMANLIRCQQVYQKAGQVKEAGMSPRGVIFRDVPRTEDTATLVPATFAPDDTVKYYRIPKVGKKEPQCPYGCFSKCKDCDQCKIYGPDKDKAIARMKREGGVRSVYGFRKFSPGEEPQVFNGMIIVGYKYVPSGKKD
jgi:hypothetical protein